MKGLFQPWAEVVSLLLGQREVGGHGVSLGILAFSGRPMLSYA